MTASISEVGPYQLLEPIGHGAMGIVRRARHLGSGRLVALKTVRAVAPHWLESIRREIDALTRISHPGVVSIFDHGIHEGRPWYAMELLEGESLRRFADRLWSPYRARSRALRDSDHLLTKTEDIPSNDAPGESGPRSNSIARPEGGPPAAAGDLAAVLRIMRRVFATLAFLHGEGFVNCDLKPENILLVDGQPVIIDFGLASRYPAGTGREELEAPTGMSGTLPYMSPEKLHGELVDARADLYSAGCIIYELVAGRPPFVGSPPSVRFQHLSSAPPLPSELATGVPAPLDQVILRLLEKRQFDRFGFADEVGTLLGELAGETESPRDFPPPRPYLYRPRLVGRDDVVAHLRDLRDRAAGGSGAFVLVGGESGVGKTRVALEVARLALGQRMRVVTSEAPVLSARNAAALGAAPLHALRPLLRAVADLCQEGGPDVTDRLVGGRLSVLTPYEPLLAETPQHEPSSAPIELPAGAARQRLFRCLAETLVAFALDQPLLWVIDDLSWADELSLDFLKTLTREYLTNTPLLILGTYRTDESTDGLAALSQMPQVINLALPRLGPEAVSSMVADMLALSEKARGFVDFVARQAEGNPFFVTEHVRAAVSERVLYRNHEHRWILQKEEGKRVAAYESLPVPRSVTDVVSQRIRALTTVAHSICLTAAVLGRELDTDILYATADAPHEAARLGLDELLRRHVLEPTEPGRLRFCHDKLRERAYEQASADVRRRLHRKAAEAIEERSFQNDDVLATLGHHFMGADVPDKASLYLIRAGDRARDLYANQHAIVLYRSALSMTSDAHERISLRERLVDVLALTGQWIEVRDALADALQDLSASDYIPRSRFLSKLAHSWEAEHMHRQALEAYENAESALGETPALRPVALAEDVATNWWGQWIHLQIERVWVHYWIGDAAAMAECVNRVRPSVESRGTAAQRARFYQAVVHENMRRGRWIISGETIALARAALEAAGETRGPVTIAYAQFVLAAALTFAHSLVEARDLMTTALAGARRTGDMVLQARCLTFFALIHRLVGDTSQTAVYAHQALQLASDLGMADYIGAAHGNLGWVAWRAGQTLEAERQTLAALDQWDKLENRYSYPVQWVARLHGLALALERGAMAEVQTHIAVVLEARQHRLPDAVCVALEAAATALTESDRKEHLNLALRCAETAGYC